MKYKKGDRVYLKKDLIDVRNYGIALYRKAMFSDTTKPFTIQNVLITGYNFLETSPDSFPWVYTDSMIDHEKTKKMKSVESLEEGEVYYVSESSKFWMIGRVSVGNNGDNKDGNLRGNVSESISSESEIHVTGTVWCYKGNNRGYRKATEDEILYLDACMKEGRFIKRTERALYNAYRFNLGDLVVVTGDIGDLCWWEKGEILKLGGDLWEDIDRNKLDNEYCFAAISKEYPSGNGCYVTTSGKMPYGLRHATSVEKKHYNEVGIGANIRVLPDFHKQTLKKQESNMSTANIINDIQGMSFFDSYGQEPYVNTPDSISPCKKIHEKRPKKIVHQKPIINKKSNNKRKLIKI